MGTRVEATTLRQRDFLQGLAENKIWRDTATDIVWFRLARFSLGSSSRVSVANKRRVAQAVLDMATEKEWFTQANDDRLEITEAGRQALEALGLTR